MSLIGHWRSRSLSASRPHNAPASSQAHLAATQAFLASRASQSNLSASAAATALRTLSPPPIPVEQVQTKRMLQRQSSTSSNGSSSRGRSRGGLQRQGSSSSMTERTFRTPSPGKSPSRPGVSDAPPVPILAENYPKPPPIPVRSQRRAVSLDSTTKPGLYHPPKKKVSRDQGVAPAQEPSNASKVAARRSTQPQRPAELERTDSKNSINFSYPRPMSPAVSSNSNINGDNALRSTMRNGLSPNGSEHIQYDLARVADQPVKKKKKKVTKPAAEGSHLQSGGMGNRPMVTPLEPVTEVPSEAQTPVAQSVKKKKKKMVAVSGENSHFPPSPPSTQTGSDSDSTPEKTRDRRSARASGMLTKQPSIVREDWEGEQEDKGSGVDSQDRVEQGLSPVGSPAFPVQSRKPAVAANVSKKIDEPPTQNKIVTQPTAQPVPPASTAPPVETSSTLPFSNLQVLDEKSHERTLSISPSRSTRFSDRLSSDMSAGRKHEPLPRSTSPAKPALKHAGGQQGVESNLSHVRTASATPSDVSELDVDGVPKRKKSARVSFEPKPEVVGTSAEPTSPETPVLASPQNKDTAKKGWFGFSKSKQIDPTTENEPEEGMGRTPQLPTFGSVREKSRRAEDDGTPNTDLNAQTQRMGNVSATSSEASSGSNIPTMETSISSDHAIGAILTHDANQNKAVGHHSSHQTNSPLPPEVTTVEGSGYVSDTESERSEDEIGNPGPAIVDFKKPESQPNKTLSSNVPELSVQPPTPALELQQPIDQWSVQLPGGFPASNEQLVSVNNVKEIKPTPVELDANPHTPTTNKGPTAATFGSIAATDSQERTTVHKVDDESSDNDSIYSDAAEDAADLDGDGFGSINAIVDSPVTKTNYQPSSPPDSPTTRLGQNKPPPLLKTDSWDGTKARWSQIAEKSRRPESPQASSPVPAEPTQAAAPPKKKKNKGVLAAASMASTAPAVSDLNTQRYSPDQTRNKPARNQAAAKNPRAGAASPLLKSSFRDKPAAQAEPAFRSSLRSGAQPGSGTRSPVPQQRASPQTIQARAALQKKHIPSASPAAPVSRVPPMPPVADDSDSESSFRKARRNRGSRDGQMRRSMRGDGPTTQNQPSGLSGRGGVRSLSPELRRPFVSTDDSKPFKRTMRGSADSGRLTLRTQSEQRKPSFFGMPRSPPPPQKRQQISNPRISRLADSDDEDNTKPAAFRSRYADSSDDEEPGQPGLRPVRGIPKAKDEEDSTDLEDSSDEEKPVTKAKPQSPGTLQIPAVSSPISPGPSSPTSEKKRGFFGRFRSKKVKEQPNTDYFEQKNTVIAPLAKDPEKDPVEVSSLTKSKSDVKGSKLGFRSAAERDAVIAETTAKLEAAQARRPNTPMASGTLRSRPQVPRVQSESWPLPPRIPSESDNRPHTSHGPGQKNVSFSQRGLGEHEGKAQGFDKSNGNAIYGRSGKKKKFTRLRKAFGLVD